MDAEVRTDLLVVGAGPFGIALAVHAQAMGVATLMLGRPMEAWAERMPHGMYLRSGCDWHLDTQGVCTIEAWLAEQGRTVAAAEPLSLADYLAYVVWLMARKGLVAEPAHVARLDHDGGEFPFLATLEDGRRVRARWVALALGFTHAANLPAELTGLLPAGRFAHTADYTDFSDAAGQRFVIVGGRQSAFEWAALLREAGAAAVHVVHRSATPAFAAADWSWVLPLVDRFAAEPGWYAGLSQAERDAIGRRMYGEGRLKLEPWLEKRVLREGVTLWPEAAVAATEVGAEGVIEVRLDGGAAIAADRIVLATGYRPQVEAIPFLAAGNILPRIATHPGCPRLDSHMQTTLPGLFMTSFAATGDFGSFFAFTVSARASALLVGQAIGQ